MVIKPEPVSRRWLSWSVGGWMNCCCISRWRIEWNAPTSHRTSRRGIFKSRLLWTHNQIHFSFIAQPRNTLDWTHHGVDMEPRRKSIPWLETAFAFRPVHWSWSCLVVIQMRRAAESTNWILCVCDVVVGIPSKDLSKETLLIKLLK